MAEESSTDRKKRAGRIVRKLARAYPDADCALHYQNAFQLLIATILSAQCTDSMVNQVTAELFPKFGTPEALANAEPSEIEQLIRRTGFYRQKTKSIQAAARGVCEDFEGEVPRTLDELVTLRGVARKTANVVLGNCFGVPGLTIDTHMKRVNRRLGLTTEENPDKIERDLMTLVPEKEWTVYSHRVITHGRECCDAKRPNCSACPLREECPH
ncbi:MAG: endonuclease III [bacterium]|nr:endonuclease III [bacterium]